MKNRDKMINDTVSNILELMPPDKKEMIITIGDYKSGDALQVNIKLSYKKITKGEIKNGKIKYEH